MRRRCASRVEGRWTASRAGRSPRRTASRSSRSSRASLASAACRASGAARRGTDRGGASKTRGRSALGRRRQPRGGLRRRLRQDRRRDSRPPPRGAPAPCRKPDGAAPPCVLSRRAHRPHRDAGRRRRLAAGGDGPAARCACRGGGGESGSPDARATARFCLYLRGRLRAQADGGAVVGGSGRVVDAAVVEEHRRRRRAPSPGVRAAAPSSASAACLRRAARESCSRRRSSTVGMKARQAEHLAGDDTLPLRREQIRQRAHARRILLRVRAQRGRRRRPRRLASMVPRFFVRCSLGCVCLLLLLAL